MWSGCYDNNPWDPRALNIFPFLIWKALSRCVVSGVQQFKARMCTRNKHGFIDNKSHTSCNKLISVTLVLTVGDATAARLLIRDKDCNISLTRVTWIEPSYAPPPHLSQVSELTSETDYVTFTKSWTTTDALTPLTNYSAVRSSQGQHWHANVRQVWCFVCNGQVGRFTYPKVSPRGGSRLWCEAVPAEVRSENVNAFILGQQRMESTSIWSFDAVAVVRWPEGQLAAKQRTIPWAFFDFSRLQQNIYTIKGQNRGSNLQFCLNESFTVGWILSRQRNI